MREFADHFFFGEESMERVIDIFSRELITPADATSARLGDIYRDCGGIPIDKV